MKLIEKFFREDKGAELSEYAVACAILVAIAFIVYQILGDAVVAKMNEVADEIDPPPAGP
jgi:Flp pilus assembly pilin Flp